MQKLRVGGICDWYGGNPEMRGWHGRFPAPLVIEEVVSVLVRAANGETVVAAASWLVLDEFETAMAELVDEQKA